MFPPGLYAIADADVTPEVVSWGKALLSAGVQTLQLRAKRWTDGRIVDAARELVASANHHQAVFILNDYPYIAAEVRAHGVHLGQTDMSPAEARSVLGPDAIIGLSTHTIEQVECATAVVPSVDYLGFGPVFDTASKAAAGTPRGPALLAEAVRATHLPVVAIGGISHALLQRIVDASPYGWAVISALTEAQDPTEAIRELSIAP